ncbi:uncharacterized protein TNCV_3090691 [Trichonephila clavipes]|uniref:Uncharacterized protein n=1 Tax=Trichonephila clavipes TaxID=2585209 RepID=A0A8X6W9P0_TRICX|nr:uncharacterized protein TNCV_3090691 [Trichonephila clavipes]
MEIRTGSSRHESSSFESVQRRSNESQYGRKRGSGVKCELEAKGISLKKDQGERHTGKTDKSGPLIRSSPGSWTEPSTKLKISRKETLGYKRSRDSRSGGPERKQRNRQNHQGEKRQLTLTSKSGLQGPRKKYRGDEIVMPSTNGYNLRQRNGTRMECRPTIEMKTQQGGPVQARNSRGQHYNPYIEEQEISGN